MVAISLQNVSKFYDGHAAVDAVDLGIQAGEFLTLLGPSGCGKSTTLRIIAGLTAPDRGRVVMDGVDVTRQSPAERRIGMVFQSLALFPHMTAAENVAFGLRMRKVAPDEIAERVAKALDLVHLGHLADRQPRQMSGGQQQRVALARALVIEPSVLILDEPFAALDRKLRETMQQELHRLTRRLGITTLFVTHDQEEALILSDWIAVMKDGGIEQFGRAGEIFETPRTRFVADFMGNPNFVSMHVRDSDGAGLLLEGQGLSIRGPLRPGLRSGMAADIALRPERIRLDTLPRSDTGPAQIVDAIYHGNASSYTVALASGQEIIVRETNDGSGQARLSTGTQVWPEIAPNAVCYLDA